MPSGKPSGRTAWSPAVVVICFVAVVATATPATAQEFPYLRAVISSLWNAPPPPSVTAEEVARESIVELAREQLGTPYRLGATSPERGFDCSGLVVYVMNQLGISLPRTAALQARIGQEVVRDRSQLRPGDLLTFGRGSRISHVGIYAGNGRYIHASSSRRQVIETALPTSSWWRGVRRVVLPQDEAPARVAQAADPADEA